MNGEAKAARRKAVLDTARHILATEGIGALHMKELALRAGVPRASLYRAYPSKEHVVRDVTLAWGIDFALRLQSEKPRGRTRGARLRHVIERLLREADGDPRLIGAVLESLLAADDDEGSSRQRIESLLPSLLAVAVDVDRMPDAGRVIAVLLRLLLANLQLMTSGHVSLEDALANLAFAAEKLVGARYWNGDVRSGTDRSEGAARASRRRRRR